MHIYCQNMVRVYCEIKIDISKMFKLPCFYTHIHFAAIDETLKINVLKDQMVPQRIMIKQKLYTL